MSPPLIDTTTALESLCRELDVAPWIAIDTEFMRERSYHAQLCLVQVATETTVACVDAQTINDLSPLTTVLFKPEIIKVMHAPQQDLEIFQQRWERLPMPLFDTQLAAALLGQGEQIGYAPLVHTLLGVTLDKSQTRTDWSRRPLSAAQLDYATDDVRFLGDLYQQLRDALLSRGRLDWLWSETQRLCEHLTATPPADALWRRVKGHRNLQGIHLAILRALARWREQQAKARDLPRQWVINDEQLITIARRKPRTREQLQRLGIDKRLIRRDGEVLLREIDRAAQEPITSWPTLPTHTPLDAQQQALLEQAQQALKVCAEQHGLAPTLLATRRDLERWLEGVQIPALHGWRNTLLGNTLRRLQPNLAPPPQ